MKRFWKGMATALVRLGRGPTSTAPTTPEPGVDPTSGSPSPTQPPTSTAPAPRSETTPRPSAPRRGRATVMAASTAVMVTTGRRLVYAPQLDGQADPGEVVWTWVVYEDDPSQGKDRPVLVVGRDGQQLLGLMLSSRRERDGQQNWFALGPGAWDRQDRPSWVRLDRVLLVPEDGIRREGAVLDRARFDAVAQALRRDHSWG